MAQLVRECAKSGALDRRTEWGSAADAAKDPAFDRPWTCSTCAWTEAELVDVSAGSAAGEEPPDPA